MKKRWMFAALVAILGLAMIGCPNGSDDDPVLLPTTPSDPGKIPVAVSIDGTQVIAQGGNATYTVTVAATNNTSLTSAQQAVTWTWAVKDSSGAPATAASGTGFVSSTRVLTVDATETAGNVITLTATSDYDASKSASINVTVFTVASLPEATAVSLTDPTSGEKIIKDATPPVLTRQFTASVTGSNLTGTEYDGVIWTLTGNVAIAGGTTLSSTGLLTVASNQVVGKLTVKATAKVADSNGAIPFATAVVIVQLMPDVSVTFYATEADAIAETNVIKTFLIEEGISIQAAGVRMPSDRNRGQEFRWKGWARYANSTVGSVVTDETYFSSDAVVVGTYYDGVFRGDASGALEKVYNENTALPVYEFDINGLIGNGAGQYATVEALMHAIKGITASYGVSEAAVSVGGPRLRAFGPYFYSSDPVVLTEKLANNEIGSSFFGDFKVDRNGAPTARLDGTAANPEKFNKFQPYLINDDGNSWGGTTPGNDTWFTHTITFNHTDVGDAVGTGYSWGKTLRLLGSTFFDDGKVDDVQVVSPTTDFTKVYFAVGLMRANAGKSIDNQDNPWDHGYIYLVKDVKLVLPGETTDVTVNGAIPSFTYPTHDYYNNDEDPAIEITGDTSDQVFASYIDPVMGSWRGAVNDPVVTPNSPGYVPPVLADAPSDIEIDLTAADANIMGYATDNSGAGTRTIISKAVDGTISVNLTTDDVGHSAGIWFALPDEYLDYAYAEIEVYYTAEIDYTVANGEKAQFASKAGQDVWNVNLSQVGANAYPSIADGDNKFRFVAGNLGTAGTVGISLTCNTYSAENVPQKYTIKFTKIVIVAP